MKNTKAGDAHDEMMSHVRGTSEKNIADKEASLQVGIEKGFDKLHR